MFQNLHLGFSSRIPWILAPSGFLCSQCLSRVGGRACCPSGQLLTAGTHHLSKAGRWTDSDSQLSHQRRWNQDFLFRLYSCFFEQS